jgi:hypothetical protein
MKPVAPGRKQSVCEAITPVGTRLDTSSMTMGEPGLPARFLWRATEHEAAMVLEKWKTTGACHHGGGERYVRRHWFVVEATDGTRMEIYFDRQPRSKQRWWLAAIREVKTE